MTFYADPAGTVYPRLPPDRFEQAAINRARARAVAVRTQAQQVPRGTPKLLTGSTLEAPKGAERPGLINRSLSRVKLAATSGPMRSLGRKALRFGRFGAITAVPTVAGDMLAGYLERKEFPYDPNADASPEAVNAIRAGNPQLHQLPTGAVRYDPQQQTAPQSVPMTTSPGIIRSVGADGVPEFSTPGAPPLPTGGVSLQNQTAAANLSKRYAALRAAHPIVRDTRNALAMGMSTREYQARRLAKYAERLRRAGVSDDAAYEFLANAGLLGENSGRLQQQQGAEAETAQIKLQQAKQLQALRLQLAALNDQNDPGGKRRRQLSHTLAVLAGRSPANVQLKTVAQPDLSEKLIAFDQSSGRATEIPVSGVNTPPTQEDLEFTAQKHGISVEEVKLRLGL